MNAWHRLVQFAGGDAWADVRGDHVERAGGERTGGAHPGEIGFPVDDDPPRLATAVHAALLLVIAS